MVDRGEYILRIEALEGARWAVTAKLEELMETHVGPDGIQRGRVIDRAFLDEYEPLRKAEEEAHAALFALHWE
jgi:hypothetical protein